jgi:hypothetical protein
VDQLKALRETPVQQPAPRRADLRIGGLTQQVVAEVVATRELLHDPAPPQLIYRFNYRVSVEVAGLGEQFEREADPGRGR